MSWDRGTGRPSDWCWRCHSRCFWEDRRIGPFRRVDRRSPQSALENSQAGPAMVQQVLAGAMPWGEQTLNDYIARIGQNLARSSGNPHALAFFLVYNPGVDAGHFRRLHRDQLGRD